MVRCPDPRLPPTCPKAALEKLVVDDPSGTTPTCPADIVKIPTGTFVMGAESPDADPDEAPKHQQETAAHRHSLDRHRRAARRKDALSEPVARAPAAPGAPGAAGALLDPVPCTWL